jgi:signal peptide peptidase SppA
MPQDEHIIELPSTTALGKVLGTPWLIMEGAYVDILQIASRSNLDILKASQLAEDRRVARLEAASGERLNGTRSVVVNSDGVAIVPVYDSLFRRADMFSSISGAMSMEAIERDFQVAMNSKNVKSVLLDVDSPGGEVNYTEHLANSILESRGMKPVETFCSGTMGSGAYWIGSASERTRITRSAVIGSVGVYAALTSTKGLEEKMGVKRIKIVNSYAPKKVPDPDTPEGEKEILSLVNSLADVFANAVAEQRGLTVKQVQDWQGAVLVGEKAVEAKMVDGLGYFGKVLGELSIAPTKTQGAVNVQLSPLANAEQEEDDVLTIVVDDTESVPEDEANGDEQEDESLNNTSNEEPIMADNNEKLGLLQGLANALGFGAITTTPATPKTPATPAATAETVPDVHATTETAPAAKSPRELALEAQAVEGIMSQYADRIVPAMRGPLEAMVAEHVANGTEDKAKTFLASIPKHGLFDDRIGVGNGYTIPVPAAEDEEKELQVAREEASAYASSENEQQVEASA